MRELYSHPDKLLEEHLFNVYQLGMKKFKDKNLNFNNLAEIKLMTEVVLITHDFGKANRFFQRKIRLVMEGKEDSREFKELDNDSRSNHSLLSAVIAYYLLDRLLDDHLLSLLGLIIVSRHHGHLKNFSDMLRISDNKWKMLEEAFVTINLEGLADILDKVALNVEINNLKFSDIKAKLTGGKFTLKRIRLKKELNEEENYLICNLLYSILISSDKAEAIFYNKGLSYQRLEELLLERRKVNPNAVDQYKQLKGWNQPQSEMDRQRNLIYDEVLENIAEIDLESERVLSINVPTGTGKTLASLGAGLKLRERVGNYRLIYTLPFTSIIDQNYDVFSEVFTKTGHRVDNSLMIKHHYLTPKSYVREEDYEDEEYDISKHLIESWNSEIIVTTFVQLLHSIFSNQNRSLIKFHNISNSIILLDEVQSIPYKYWQLVKVILEELAHKLDSYFIFITATMPLICSEEKNEIKELAQGKEDYFRFFDRIELDLSYFREKMNLEQFKDFIFEELEEYYEKNFLIILNTIKSSVEVYDFINQLLETEEIEGEIIYLSTNIIPKQRIARIDEIGSSKQRQIIVSTQMVEAGVDIDLDRVYRDFGPLDSINQSCGRCNRNFDQDNKGVVTVVKLVNENHNNKEYASYVYGDVLLRETDNLLKELADLVEEKEFFAMNNRYFKRVDRVKSEDISIKLLDNIKSLEYKNAFWDDQQGEVFQLIEQDFETVNLFIELDEDAQEVWQEYEEINRREINSPQDYSKRQADFEKIKKNFLAYVIIIPKRVAKEYLEDKQLENTFNLIDYYQWDSLYDEATGFKRNKTEIDTFF